MNARHICLYFAARIGRWNYRRLEHPPCFWHAIDRISLRLYEAANR